MADQRNFKNIVSATSLFLLLYFLGMLFYSQTGIEIKWLNAVLELITIPFIVLLCCIGFLSLVKWITTDKFRLTGYFVPLLLSVSTAVILLCAD